MTFELDPAHEAVDIFELDITKDVWKDKYRYKDESSPHASHRRVSEAIMGIEKDPSWAVLCYEAMCAGLWMPGGRIQAGAGTERNVTLHNCYVNATLEDSMEGIMLGLSNAAYTLRQGGGIGTDFTPLRPEGARLKRLGAGAVSSGAVSFMGIWDAMCATIMSAGYRRGAMMGTLACWHPDIEKFIEAKHKAGVLTNFNVSVLVTDEFMYAVKNDLLWDLYHKEPPTHEARRVTGKGYVYKTLPARELWEKILRSTHQYSEPGVIFIDKVNRLNNLRYCETISCTNPCGEQPLPPHGACDLGAINLARLVRKPFSPEAYIDIAMLRTLTALGVRFLDNVIDVSKYPLEDQSIEQRNKRRIGLGISGLGSALVMLGIRYGSQQAQELASAIMHEIAMHAYKASIELAREKGSFPLFSVDDFTNSAFIEKLGSKVTNDIKKHGIRNGVLLTIAPVGTNSLYYGDISSGLEPVFSFEGRRKVRQPDGQWAEYVREEYSWRMYKKLGIERMYGYNKDALVDVSRLTVEDHISMQAACQRWVDASVSKTINCPEGISFEDFAQVYQQAYDTGCKGCTTYTPSEVRGSILTSSPKAETGEGATRASTAQGATLSPLSTQAAHSAIPLSNSQGSAAEGAVEEPSDHAQSRTLDPRPSIVEGKTYKLKWPSRDAALYVTINNLDGKPYEIFVNSRSAENAEWMTALTRMISSVMRQTSDIKFVPDELMQVASAHDSNWVNGRFFQSLVAYLGYVIKCHIEGKDPSDKRQSHTPSVDPGGAAPEGVDAQTQANRDSAHVLGLSEAALLGVKCPRCGVAAYTKQEGCATCINCGYSTCS